MHLRKPILKILNKKYERASFIECTFRKYDLAFKTDDQGNPILLFLGKKSSNGFIKGERYVRILRYDTSGKVIKDHWERKGEAS